MLIISGTRKFKRSMGSMSRKVICNICGKEVELEVVRVISWFTFFFIPLFPYSFKYYLLCPNCEMGYKLDKQKAKEILADYPTNNTEII